MFPVSCSTSYHTLHQELEQGIEKFVKDKNTDCAKMRSALKLITVTPINSISASSNEHMANKVFQIRCQFVSRF